MKDLAALSLPDAARNRLERAREGVLGPLSARWPDVSVRVNVDRLEAVGYYSGLMLRISVESPKGFALPLIDGGFTDWTQRLLDDRKERFLGTGIGTDAILALFPVTGHTRAGVGP